VGDRKRLIVAKNAQAAGSEAIVVGSLVFVAKCEK
jgi:hypothetical protein